MSGLMPYYVSRLALAAFLVGFLLLVGSPWYVAALLGALLVAFFLWAPRSGRYTVKKDPGALALQRDEWAQTIAHKSGRNAFVILMLAIAALALYFGLVARAGVPVSLVTLLGLLGMASYFVSDLWLRRT
jgi:nitrogen fixation-related uncharacterized protein